MGLLSSKHSPEIWVGSGGSYQMGDTLTGPVIGILVAQVQSRQKILGLAYQ